MPEVVVSFDEATAEQLDVERELLGFDTRAEYLAWIVENRAAIDKGTERERLLRAYEDRIEALERRLDELEALESDEEGPGTATDDAGMAAGSQSSNSAGAAASDRSSGRTGTAADDSPAPTGTPNSTAQDSPSTETVGSQDEPSGTPAATADDNAGGPARSHSEPESATAEMEPAEETSADGRRPARSADAEIGGTPDMTVRSPGDSATTTEGSDDGGSDRRDDGLAGVDRIEGSTTVNGGETSSTEPSSSAEEAGVESMHLAPERVSRVSEDTVGEDADVLSGVETNRLDEISRRAVAKTRKRLDRDVETGLSYRSSTSLADSEVRAGDDITDLETLDLPGRSDETLQKRQEAAGMALAFLRDEGRARRSDFVDALYEECPAEYGTEDGWWSCIKEALKQVEAVDGGKGTRVWRFRD